jgi:hypothetical protein
MTAVLGGYALAGGLSALLARLLPIGRADATAWALNLSFAIFAAVLLWVFCSNRLWRTSAIVWGGALAAALWVWAIGLRP